MRTTGVAVGATAMALADQGEAVGAQAVLRVRPNVATLSVNGPQIRALKAGVARMRSLNTSQPKSWVAQANIHNNFCPHGNWFFLPWHRAYLFYFEQICREASGVSTFTLPYWDWSTSPRLPAAFWGAGNTLNDNTRQIGPNDPANPAFVAPSVITTILQNSNFQTFGSGLALQQRPTAPPFGATGRLEGTPHNYIHNFVGGDMGTFMSPLDPIFWLHHANIDRLWAEWARLHPGRTPNDPRWLNFNLNRFFDLSGNPVNRRVSEMLSTYALGYRYDTQPAAPVVLVMSAAPEVDTVPETLRSAAPVERPATFAAPLTVSLALTAPLRQRLGVLAATPAPQARQSVRQTLRLAVEGITPPKDTRVEVRVFVNEEKPDANTPIDGPTYLGSVTFFNGAHTATAEGHGEQPKGKEAAAAPAAGHGKVSFYFDLDDAVERLVYAGLYKDSDKIQVSLVPVPLRPHGPESATIDPSRISLWAVD